MKKGIILLSGGLDSTVLLYLAKKKGYNLRAIIFDYKQRHKKEIEFAKKIARLNGIKYYLINLDLSWTRSSLTQKNIKIPTNRCLKNKTIPVTYVAGRNIIFLSYAASLADSIGATRVFIGAHTQDYSGYPDCRPEFIKSMQNSCSKGLGSRQIKLAAPLINMDKKAIIRLGLRLGVPFKYTWSCYQGRDYPCGKCDSCRFREKAFGDLGIVDPLLGKLKNS